MRSPDQPARAHPKRRLLVLPLAFLVALAGLRMVTMFWFAAAGTAAYDDGRYAAAALADFDRLMVLDLVDPWRTDLGAGAAAFRQGDLLAAETSFAAALADEPARCDLRFNLAVTVEAQGDRALSGTPLAPDADADFTATDAIARPELALARYNAALAIIDAGDCPSTAADDAGDRLTASRARIEAKLAALADAPRQDDPDTRLDESADNERGDSEQIDELTNRNEAGAAQRKDAAHDADTNGRAPTDQSNW